MCNTLQGGFFLQLKPVGSRCNIRCDYCYVKPFRKRGDKRVMSQEVLERAISDCVYDNDLPIITWHGGEPTFAGLGFFIKAMEIAHSCAGDKPCRNILQTNAILIDREFAAFLKESGFEVSVSLDGPREVHGIHRKCRGRNTFNKVMRGISNLREAGIEPAVIATITQESLPFAEEIFGFFAAEGFRNLKFNAVYDSSSDQFNISPDQWLDFLERIFAAWLNLGDSDIAVREIDEVISWIQGSNLPLCSNESTCLSWVSVDPDGELYPCEYLRSLAPYGNIREMALAEIRATEGFAHLQSMFESFPRECRECEFLSRCGNGCPATRIRDGKLSPDGIFVYCKERKGLFQHVRGAFDKIMQEGE